ncbi:hypothetical protein [Hydrogenophaga sp.]|uniref:hypothetical protein n=1 Tax=Hydrogenophaga sp. TaxID=1904254 RepID=UPI003F6F70F4
MPTCKLVLISVVAFLTACAAHQAPSPASPPAATPAASGAAASSDSRTVPSRDGSYQGEITGQARPGSKFARLQVGMNMEEVQTVLGRAPDRLHTYESGKRWIPFYFGNDARRMQVLYKGEGCLILTGGNVWGGAGGDLVSIHHDATGACYQP